jgi:hypothetical protein
MIPTINKQPIETHHTCLQQTSSYRCWQALIDPEGPMKISA